MPSVSFSHYYQAFYMHGADYLWNLLLQNIVPWVPLVLRPRLTLALRKLHSSLNIAV